MAGLGEMNPDNLGEDIQLDELETRIRELRTMFEIVRLVDPKVAREVIFTGDHALQYGNPCTEAWEYDERSGKGIASRVYEEAGRVSKFEFSKGEIFFVVAQALRVQGQPYVLEAVHRMSDSMMSDAFGQMDLVERLSTYNNELYADSLTKVRNRRYYDERLAGLTCMGVVMFDIDNFKDVNDSWGHEVGDEALRTVASAAARCVRQEDSVVRYGGDEFLLAFVNIPYDVFCRKLDQIRRAVEKARIETAPDLHVTISVGGYYGQGTVRELMPRADKALYMAKRQRNMVTVDRDETQVAAS